MESQTNIPDGVYNLLPTFLQELCSPFQGREKDIVLLSSLGVMSATLPKVFGIYNGQKYRPNLYIMIVAPPASGKGSMNNSKKLINKIHNRIKEISEGNIEDCKAENKTSKTLNNKCPELEVKVLPGNVSSSKIYKHIKNSKDGLLIFETEADTISMMIKQDWGNFSDVMRKAFHHESISISREIDDKFIEVPFPELSMVISGTPNQVKPFIQSRDKGLFSRFLFYFFEETSKWKDVSPAGVTNNFNNIFTSAGDTLFELHGKLQRNTNDIEIKLSESQWSILNSQMDLVVNLFIHLKNTDSISTLKRHAVMMFRMCMILTIIRHKDNETFANIIECSDDDFSAALQIMKTAIDHSISVANLLSDKKKELPVLESLLIANLNPNFSRAEAVEQGRLLNIPTRTVDSILSRWLNSGIILKISQGNYQIK